MWIFPGVPWRVGAKQQWGNRKRGFSSFGRRGGATGGGEGYEVPPTFAVCTPQGVQRNLRCTPVGYYRLQLATKVTQFTFGFST